MVDDLENICRRICRFSSLVIFVCSVPTIGIAAEDDYLKSLEAESNKIVSDPGKRSKGADEAAGAGLTLSDEQRVEFETYLEERHKGTFAFYRKLPERSREEVFKSFVDGASMSEIRQMVIDRKMNR